MARKYLILAEICVTQLCAVMLPACMHTEKYCLPPDTYVFFATKQLETWPRVGLRDIKWDNIASKAISTSHMEFQAPSKKGTWIKETDTELLQQLRALFIVYFVNV